MSLIGFVLVTAWLTARVDAATTICTASDLCAPAANPCTISGVQNVASGCTLDFGARSVVVTGTLQSATAPGSYALSAGDLTLNGGRIRALGPTGLSGGNVTLTVAGAVVLSGSGPTLDVSGAEGGGLLTVNAGSIDVRAGSVAADGTSSDACGGAITLHAAPGPLRMAVTVHATGSSQCSGGQLDLAGQSVEVDAALNTSGGDGPGGILITANAGDIVIAGSASLKANGEQVDIDSGGDGGPIELDADSGNVTVLGAINADGGSPDGSAGSIDISAAGTVQVGAQLSLQGNGAGSSGGDVTIETDGDTTFAANVRTNGGSDGEAGDIDVSSGGTITVAAGKALQADAGSFGAGSISFEDATSIVIAGGVEAKSSGGPAGFITLESCRASIGGTLDTTASGGGVSGANAISAGLISITSSGVLNAAPCNPLIGSSCNILTIPAGAPTIDPVATVNPAPLVLFDPLLNLCCGNGTIEPGEQCDDGNGLACDGCSNFCQIETNPPCPSDGNECTQDCSPAAGCTYSPRTGQTCTDDGDVCTTDTCSASAHCQHTPRVCNDGVACTVDSCSAGVGCVATPNDALCDDGDTCTDQHCDRTAGCVYTKEPDGTSCSDNDACTTGDTCTNGKCVPQGPPLRCDDDNPCTTDSCVAEIGCYFAEDSSLCPCTVGGVPKPQGAPCADGDECTQGDVCDGAGGCQSGPSCPDDGNACTREMCLHLNGGNLCIEIDDQCVVSCAGQSDGTPCSDHSACTTGVCQGGSCVDSAIPCGDGDSCTGIDYCLDAIGCRSSAPPIDDPMCTPPPSGLDAFTCYRTKESKGGPDFAPLLGVPIDDRFGAALADLLKSEDVCLPVDVNGADPSAPGHADNLSTYQTRRRNPSPSGLPTTNVAVVNQFGTLHVDLKKPDVVQAPSALSTSVLPGPPVPPEPDHLSCYKIALSAGSPRFLPIIGVTLVDQFGSLTVDLKRPMHLCTPLDVNGDDPTAPTHAAQLLCYQARPSLGTARFVKRSNVFLASDLGPEKVDVATLEELCVPSTISAP